MAWPFARVAGGDEGDLAILEREGVSLAQFADPDTRMRHAAVMELLDRAVARSGKPTLGIIAGETLDAGDLGVLDQVVATCATLRDGVRAATRHSQLMNEASRTSLEEGTDVAIWRFETVDSVVQHPAANDFVVVSMLQSWRRYTGIDEAPIEVHMMHTRATSESEYARVFRCPVRLGMPSNAILVRRSFLDTPLVHASPGLNMAFERHASGLSARLQRDTSVAGRARNTILGEVGTGDPSMETVARKMAMSVATLRRRLDEEGTSHRQLVDEVRSDLAQRYLLDDNLAIGEVAFLLGFSHVTAFYKAFKRWMDGATPAEFRARARAERAATPAGREGSGQG